MSEFKEIALKSGAASVKSELTSPPDENSLNANFLPEAKYLHRSGMRATAAFAGLLSLGAAFFPRAAAAGVSTPQPDSLLNQSAHSLTYNSSYFRAVRPADISQKLPEARVVFPKDVEKFGIEAAINLDYSRFERLLVEREIRNVTQGDYENRSTQIDPQKVREVVAKQLENPGKGEELFLSAIIDLDRDIKSAAHRLKMPADSLQSEAQSDGSLVGMYLARQKILWQLGLQEEALANLDSCVAHGWLNRSDVQSFVDSSSWRELYVTTLVAAHLNREINPDNPTSRVIDVPGTFAQWNTTQSYLSALDGYGLQVRPIDPGLLRSFVADPESTMKRYGFDKQRREDADPAVQEHHLFMRRLYHSWEKASGKPGKGNGNEASLWNLVKSAVDSNSLLFRFWVRRFDGRPLDHSQQLAFSLPAIATYADGSITFGKMLLVDDHTKVFRNENNRPVTPADQLESDIRFVDAVSPPRRLTIGQFVHPNGTVARETEKVWDYGAGDLNNGYGSSVTGYMVLPANPLNGDAPAGYLLRDSKTLIESLRYAQLDAGFRNRTSEHEIRPLSSFEYRKQSSLALNRE